MSYVWVGLLWTISNMLVLGASYGAIGAITAGAANAIIMSWIWMCYTKSFKKAQQQYNLPPPKINFF